MNLTRYLLSDIALLRPLWLRLMRHAGRGLSSVLLSLVVAILYPIPPSVNPREHPIELKLVRDINHDALPQERPVEVSARVMLRLEETEKAELNPHFRDDIRIAWITTLFALRDEPEPHVQATYRVLGIHPDKVAAAIEARRRAQLGAEYDQFFVAPKKPVRSERRVRPRKENDGERAA